MYRSTEIHSGMNGKYDILLLIMSTVILLFNFNVIRSFSQLRLSATTAVIGFH